MRLIDADKSDEIIVFDKQNELLQCSVVRDYCERQREFLNKFPTIDAEPVRHGHWIETIEDGKMKRVTSCCGDDQTKLTVWYKPDYCPHCGAKMRGTEDE